MRAVFISRTKAALFAERVLKFSPDNYYIYIVYNRGAIVDYELWVGGRGCWRPVLESEVEIVQATKCR